MAFVWVQQWFALPVVIEEPMGDLPLGSGPQALDITATGIAHDDIQSHAQHPLGARSPTSSTPFYSQLSSIPQSQLRRDLRSPAHPSSPHYPQDHGATSLNMSAMAGSLPEYASADGAHLQHAQRQLSGASTSALVYQLQQNLQVHGPASNTLPVHPGYGASFGPGQFQQAYIPAQASSHSNYTFPPNQQRGPGPNSIQPPYQNYPQQSPYLYYPAPYGTHHFVPGFSAQNAQTHALYGRRPSLASTQAPLPGQSLDMSPRDGVFPHGHHTNSSAVQVDPASMGWIPGGQLAQSGGIVRPDLVSSIPRGPPRKPKQSGHALWVGNLPPGTTVISLKDHFSRDATKDIESLFLISKSNCAFVNYRTETSCTAAMHRFHDSRFNGVRLVCRLRRSSAPASGVPTGPSAMVGAQATNPSPPTPLHDDQDEGLQPATEAKLALHKSDGNVQGTSGAPDRYFIVKSLTLQDLELSLRNGIWATQSHNEDALNSAFETAENVYLIFSANKSGEYFGYARMTSRILDDDVQLIGSAPKQDNILEATDVPKSIPTPATEFAPKGRIIDDSARGTIFWEAELTDSEGEEDQPDKEDAQTEGEAPAVAQSWGKPFRIEWISTTRLPFYRTRGLRNPWNANREVKIARDGTELEPSVGERLLQMFRGPISMPLAQPPVGAHMRPF
ncbi:uncharacterized protein CC84DRAFT_1223494 [Paraphaeosphaeria sporulosa]|uniref:YTH domain-containing protein n=1 Tax=Paraphaeosphaeria sporulosa TaxID=1460663 RepID=A0A177BUD1_9PLEO|nr:uncharacterized protein CC84DRAFT_1223494 [Paraphaeosphaeria sporulosa]OAF98745.1 hypothetical protein CC84DRAFT_1223494 [Paraphaeosphaeria sporulosa]